MRVRITNIKLHYTKNGQEMAFIEAYSRYTVIIMPNLYSKVKDYLIIGRWIELQGFNTHGKIMATQIQPVLTPITSSPNLVLA